jgi:exonuclease III
VGLLTKIEPIDVKFGINITEHDTEGRVITAEYDQFYLVLSYIPNSGRKLVRLAYRRRFNEVFHSYLKELEKKKSVIWLIEIQNCLERRND